MKSASIPEHPRQEDLPWDRRLPVLHPVNTLCDLSPKLVLRLFNRQTDDDKRAIKEDENIKLIADL
jgi:hypothetical protein